MNKTKNMSMEERRAFAAKMREKEKTYTYMKEESYSYFRGKERVFVENLFETLRMDKKLKWLNRQDTAEYIIKQVEENLKMKLDHFDVYNGACTEITFKCTRQNKSGRDPYIWIRYTEY